MRRPGSMRREMVVGLIETSPLRRIDPRAKLVLCLGVALAVMAPLLQLLAFMLAVFLLISWAQLIERAARQIWRLKLVLILLFAVDWLVIGLDLALVVTLRLMLLSVIFVLFFGTTTPAELCLALEKLRVPYRYAFSVGLAFESLSYLSEEWHSVREAQQARGIGLLQPGWRSLPSQVRNLVGLVVPAIVLTTKRAWSVTEAAYARGFDSPHRLPFRTLAMRYSDWLVIASSVSVAALFTIWR